MTLNGEMAFILRYFTEFVSFWVALLKVVDKAVTMNQCGNFVADSYIQDLMRSTCLAIV